MSIQLIVTVLCSDCGEPLETKEEFTSASEARVFAATEGWQLVRVHRLDLDFCPDCQETSAVAIA